MCYDTAVERERRLIARLALVVYFFTAGAILVAVPWTALWPIVGGEIPWLVAVLTNPAARGAVSGFGLVLVIGAIVEIRDAVHRSE